MSMPYRLLEAPQLIVAYIATVVVFFALDFVWLSNMTASFYRPRLGSLLLDEPNIAPAAVFYMFYAAGVVYFAVTPAIQGGVWWLALLNGAILGALAYGTYDMTNLATLRGWSGMVSLVDMLWGCFVTAASGMAGWIAVRAMRAYLGG